MLDDLKFVQGAVAKKDILPALTHFKINKGLIKGYNGRIAICSPIQLDVSCQPKAIAMIKAIEACKETVQLNMTPNGRLSVKSGKFKAFVDCAPEDFPEVGPEGTRIDLTGIALLGALKVLEPFIADDASRPWARGILFRGQSAYATNNVILCEYWHGYNLPCEINVPHEAVNELLRIKVEPVAIQVDTNSVTFHYENGRWLRTQTYSTEWPNVDRVLNVKCDLQPVTPGFFEGVETLIPFVSEGSRVFIKSEGLATSETDGEGANVVIEGLEGAGCFNIQLLRLLAPVVEQIAFIDETRIMFQGKNIRGAMAGMMK